MKIKRYSMFDYYNEALFLNKTVFKNDPVIAMGVFKCEKTKEPRSGGRNIYTK